MVRTEPTPRQRELLEYLISHVEEHGRQPTMRETCRRFGWTGSNAVRNHYQAMERHGLIRLVGSRRHGVQIVGVKFRRVEEVMSSGVSACGGVERPV